MQNRAFAVIGILLFWAISVTGNVTNIISSATPNFTIVISGIVITIFTLIAMWLIPFIATLGTRKTSS